MKSLETDLANQKTECHRYPRWVQLMFAAGALVFPLLLILSPDEASLWEATAMLGTGFAFTAGAYWSFNAGVFLRPDGLDQIRPFVGNRSIRFEDVQRIEFSTTEAKFYAGLGYAAIPMGLKDAMQAAHTTVSRSPAEATQHGSPYIKYQAEAGRKVNTGEFLRFNWGTLLFVSALAFIFAGLLYLYNSQPLVPVEDYHTEPIRYSRCRYDQGSQDIVFHTRDKRYRLTYKLLSLHPNDEVDPSAVAERLAAHNRATVWVDDPGSTFILGIESPALSIGPEVGAKWKIENARTGWQLFWATAAIGAVFLLAGMYGFFAGKEG